MRQSNVIFNNMKDVLLQRDIDRYLRNNPGKTLKDALQHVIFYEVPSTVRGSPSWWRQRRQDLEAMVAEFGLPTAFLTLTQDDTSETR